MTLTSEQIDAMLPAAREAILATQSASPAMLQRVLKLGWNAASELMSRFEGELVSAPGPDGQRTILPRLLDLTHQAHPRNSYWVVPDSLMAGEYPGERDAWNTRRKLADYLRHGLDAFLDLTEAGELRPYEDDLNEVALLRNSIEGRTAPDPRRIYPTRTVSGVPSCVNRFKMAARTCNSAT